jgi:hypothetical protein
MFDYYELKFVFHGADCKRRAADMDEARAAKKELQAAGIKEITIYGVKKGTKEIQAAKKAYIKPEFKHEPAPKAAKTPKAAKVPKTKKKAAKCKKTAVKMTGTTGTYTTDYKTEKKAKAAAENIRSLGFDTEIIEPAGQLDLFNYEFENENKKIILSFTQNDLNSLTHAFYSLIDSGEKMPAGYKKLLDTFTESPTNGNVKIEISFKEIRVLTQICQMYLKKYIVDKGKSSIYDTITNLKKLFIMYL